MRARASGVTTGGKGPSGGRARSGLRAHGRQTVRNPAISRHSGFNSQSCGIRFQLGPGEVAGTSWLSRNSVAIETTVPAGPSDWAARVVGAEALSATFVHAGQAGCQERARRDHRLESPITQPADQRGVAWNTHRWAPGTRGPFLLMVLGFLCLPAVVMLPWLLMFLFRHSASMGQVRASLASIESPLNLLTQIGKSPPADPPK